MTREEAIRILDPETTVEAIAEIEYYGGFNGKTAAVQAVSDACMLAVAALREQEERRWIPVTERLPEPKHEFDARNWYLVALSNGVVKELAYEFNNNSVFGYGWRETAYPVTHWMPMPHPPKGE